MTYLIQLIDLSLSFSKQCYFESFNQNLFFGDRIALIGDNGCGKSSLLKIITKIIPPSEGVVKYNQDIIVSYVPQLRDITGLSGAEQFNRCLTNALAQQPDVLVLDEPTNHLDKYNRQSLMRLMDQFYGTLIIATHDMALLKHQEYSFWHFKQKRISVFQGHFEHLMQQNALQNQIVHQELDLLHKEKKQYHEALMREQKRAKSSRTKGEKSIDQAKWPTIVSKTKFLNAQETSGRKKKALFDRKEHLISRLNELGCEEEINPQFSISPGKIHSKSLVTINNGSLFYAEKPILDRINLNITSHSRLAVCGKNGSGKSTLIKAIMGDLSVRKEGLWITPALKDIGYLDQHYQHIEAFDSVFDVIQQCQPSWSHNQVRAHLNDFLFRKNEQVNRSVALLSGGEKARLSLASIAANPPKLLILDEITNNLDLKTRAHVLKLVQNYPSAFIIISHDEDFLQQIYLNDIYTIDSV